ncbi:MAG TPA: hypothetical protein VGP13_02130 [Candidatus Paceibacterota bacterium]|jgi:hypothetical protein|nr:hypothetical protein [Candidatus Paceibacterota bacterium]
MQKERLHIKPGGFSIIELIVAAGLMLLLATAFTGAVLYGEEGTQIAGQRMRATLLAEEGIQAARNVRDQSFSNLVDSTYGLAQSGGVWFASGASDTQDIFTRSITVSPVDAVTKQVVSTVTWPENAVRNGSVSLTTYLTNTQLLATQANSLVVNVAAANAAGVGNVDMLGVTLKNVASSTVTVTQIQASWSGVASITQVLLNAVTVWSGTQSSGSILNITDTPIATGITIPVTRFRFTADMTGKVITIIFTMLDGSTKTVITPALP